MNEGISVKPDKIRLITLLDDISDGVIQVPIFQRDFVWNQNQMIELFDSLIKGYPIGSLLFWKPKTKFNTNWKIGPFQIENIDGNENVSIGYVLDGFQRITTLFGALTNPSKYGILEEDEDYRKYFIHYDLKENEFVYIKNKKDRSPFIIPLYKLIDTFEFLDVLELIRSSVLDKQFVNTYINRAKQITKIFSNYDIPYVEIIGGDIRSAVEIFSRINSTGTDISEDFMLSALSYNEDTGFLLVSELTEFLHNIKKYNFDTLKRDIILDCISCSTGQIYFDIKIEELRKKNIESLTRHALIHVEKAVDFVYKRLYIMSPIFLPYPIQFVFISEFFRINPSPSENDLQKLISWFWITSYSNYFTIHSPSQQRSAYSYFCDFASNLNTDGVFKTNQEIKFTTAKFLDKLNFGSVRSKSLQLFILKTALDSVEVAENDSIKDFFISTKKEKAASNVIFRLTSEFTEDKRKKNIKTFIEDSDIQTLSKYFIDQEAVDLFKNNRIEDFLSRREISIKSAEKQFVESFGIQYTD